MENSRFRGVIAWVQKPWTFREIKYALWMMGLALIPTTAVFFVFMAVSKDAIASLCRVDRSAITGNDLAPLFNYYIAWVAHLLISIGVAVEAERNAFRNIPQTTESILKQFRLLAFLVTLLAVIVGDDLHCNLAVLSHDRIFSVLSVPSSILRMFRPIPTRYTPWGPVPFSLFPIAGLGVAFWSTATIILCASKFLVELEDSNDEPDPNDRLAAFSKTLDALRSHFLALSLVLVTSTLGTVAFLRIPLGFLAEGERRNFRVIADAIGLVWGVSFSLTLVALCFVPFHVLRERMDTLHREARETGSPVAGQWIEKNGGLLELSANLQLVLSVDPARSRKRSPSAPTRQPTQLGRH